jgi:hypothetical protein
VRKFRKRKRAITDSEAIVHPGELQRPFRTDESEPGWLVAELRPPYCPASARGEFGVKPVSGWPGSAESLGLRLTSA